MLENMKKKKKKKGFTLIELIIVIAIIAIIAAIAIPKLIQSKQGANDTADIANAKTIANAAQTAIANDEIKPSEFAEGDAILSGTVLNTTSSDENIEKIVANLQGVPTLSAGGDFFVKLGKDGSITVYGSTKDKDGKSAIDTSSQLFPQDK